MRIKDNKNLSGENAQQQADRMMWNMGKNIGKKVSTAATYYQQRAR